MSPVQTHNDHENQQIQTPAEGSAPKRVGVDWKLLAGGGGIAAILVAWNLLGGAGPAKSADDLVSLSLQHAQQGRFQQCVDAGLQAVKVKPDMATAYNNIGWCYGKLGNWDEALRNTREALRLDPNMDVVKNNLAWILEQKPKSAPAPGDAELSASNQHAQAGQYSECIDAAQKALKLNPKQAIAYNNIGWCSAKLEKWSDGYESLRAALQIQPDLQIAENNRRWVAEEMTRRGIKTGR